MPDAFVQLLLFTAKSLVIFLIIFSILIAFFVMAAKSKDKLKGRLLVKHLNKKYEENAETILSEIMPKKAFKQFLKEKKQKEKENSKSQETPKNIFVLNFHGDIKASAVSSLREEVTAILNIARPVDEVVVCIESGGGMVNGYGLAAAQLMRIRARHIPLTIAIDKIAASGGYMMACVANKIIAAPFAIIGSIGVIVQLPNFNRFLKDKDIDVEMHTAGQFKRTITMFGENTNEGREKLKHDLEDIHEQFKQLIAEHRQHIDINKVATGEHWLGQQALALNLIDHLQTSDDYLLERSKNAQLFEVSFETKKSFLNKLTGSGAALWGKLFGA